MTTKNKKMNLSFFLFFFCIVRSSKYRIYKKKDGLDHRPDITEPPSGKYRISKYFEKKRLLTALENPQTPIYVKKRMLEDREIKPPNIFAGGLMRDFLFDMDGEN